LSGRTKGGKEPAMEKGGTDGLRPLMGKGKKKRPADAHSKKGEGRNIVSEKKGTTSKPQRGHLEKEPRRGGER